MSSHTDNRGECNDCGITVLVKWEDSYPVTPRPAIVKVDNGGYTMVCNGCFNKNHRHRYQNLR